MSTLPDLSPRALHAAHMRIFRSRYLARRGWVEELAPDPIWGLATTGRWRRFDGGDFVGEEVALKEASCDAMRDYGQGPGRDAVTGAIAPALVAELLNQLGHLSNRMHDLGHNPAKIGWRVELHACPQGLPPVAAPNPVAN